MSKEYNRRGDQCKCPACGWRLDSEAYRCPKCFIYFCFKCRARVGKGDQQYQCADQSCSCYGKLLCGACTISVPIEKMVTKYTETPSQFRRGWEYTEPEKKKEGSTADAIAGLFFVVWMAGSVALGLYSANNLANLKQVLMFFVAIPIWSGLSYVIFLSLNAATATEPVPQSKVPDSPPPESYEVKEVVGYHRCCIQCQHPVKDIS